MTPILGAASVERSNSIVVAVCRRPRISAPVGSLLLPRPEKISTDLVMSTELMVTVWMPLALLTTVPDWTCWRIAACTDAAGKAANSKAETATSRAIPCAARVRGKLRRRSAEGS